MLPNLTAGSINRILDGEEVTGAVMQILGCKKIPGTGNDRYRLLISDSVAAYSFVMLGTHLNTLVTNKELEKFTVVRVDKCVCNQILPEQKVIILLSLAVLAPGAEVGERIGNPVPVNPTTSVSNAAEANNNRSSSMLPYLTAGSINRILDGEEVTGAVMQILGCQKVPGVVFDRDRYRLLISDSVALCSCVMLGTQLNSLVTNKELEQFAVVRVDKYVFNQLQSDRKVIILLSLIVLAPGAEVGEKIGNPVPVNPTTSVSNAAEANNNRCSSMLPYLTAGSINRILDGEEVTGAVMQILGCQKVPGVVFDRDRYQLLISDSVALCSCVMLGTQLNSLVTNKELEQFAIVRVDKYVFNQLQSDRKVIILLSLIVLAPGAEVGEKIGNPVPVNPTTSASNAAEANNNCSSSMLPHLTAGSINQILDGEEVTGAVIQILGSKKVPGAVFDRYRLLISDSVTLCSCVMLGTQLNSLVANKELEQFAVVRVDKYVFNEMQSDRKVIILLSLTVLAPGAEVGEKIGNPVPVNPTTSASNAAETNNNCSSSMLPHLTAGSINRILDGEEVTGAVMQILCCKKVSGAVFDRYRLMISDSVVVCSFVMLDTQLNSLVTNKELQRFTVVRVDKCVCKQMQQPDQKVIILLSLTVLTPGAEVGVKMGNPVPAKTEDLSQMFHTICSLE